MSFTYRKRDFGGGKTSVRNFAGGKIPCGLGRPRHGLAKLRVAFLLRENCLVGWAADGAVFWTKNNVFSPDRMCILLKDKCVFFTEKMCLPHKEYASS